MLLLICDFPSISAFAFQITFVSTHPALIDKKNSFLKFFFKNLNASPKTIFFLQSRLNHVGKLTIFQTCFGSFALWINFFATFASDRIEGHYF